MPTRTKKPCPHTELTKVIDKLGIMTDRGARVLEYHYECTACGATVPQEKR